MITLTASLFIENLSLLCGNDSKYSFMPTVSATPGKLLVMQILRPHPRSTESETLGVGLRNLCFNKPSPPTPYF